MENVGRCPQRFLDFDPRGLIPTVDRRIELAELKRPRSLRHAGADHDFRPPPLSESDCFGTKSPARNKPVAGYPMIRTWK